MSIPAFSGSPLAQVEYLSDRVEDTVHIGRRLGALLRGGDLICLSGDLGAGKTAFTAGIGMGWGAAERVHSPTFVFVHEHTRRIDAVRLYHVDCYRLTGPDDAVTIGLDEILSGESIVVLEWPERVESMLPPDQLWVYFDLLDASDARRLTFSATGTRSAELVQTLRSSPV